LVFLFLDAELTVTILLSTWRTRPGLLPSLTPANPRCPGVLWLLEEILLWPWGLQGLQVSKGEVSVTKRRSLLRLIRSCQLLKSWLPGKLGLGRDFKQQWLDLYCDLGGGAVF